MPILTPQERIGHVVGGRYRLDALLSTGGMGVLFRAFDCERAAPAAVKMLKPTYALEADRVARFVREAGIARQVTHPHIARTFDAFPDESGVPFFVMELLEGRTLAQELDERSVLPLEETLAIVLPIMRALEAAHALGIVHRDVKPSNIFLCCGAGGCMTPKLIDFGIAKGPQSGFETETGVLLGTPGYMAPEQVQYAECSVFTDIWGIGAVLYRCLAGHPPHAASTPCELLQKLVREPVPPLAAPGIGRPLCATVDRALARDPHRRYASMRAFAHALETFAGRCDVADTDALRVSDLPLAVQHDIGSPHGRKLGRVSGAGLVLGCALAVSAFVAARAGDANAARRGTAATVDAPLTDVTATVAAPAAVEAAALVYARRVSPVETMIVPNPPVAVRRPRGAAPRLRRTAASVERATAVELEATTGLPVATEW
jgi:serine/threonine-protein kinase